jgi:nucleotide-binding universal stress UspA family protein
MSSDKDVLNTEVNEVINPDGSVTPGIEQEQEEEEEEQQSQSQSENESMELQDYSISKNNIPSFNKILVTDDGKDISNKALNYGVALSNSTGAELTILRIFEDFEKFDDVNVEGYSKDSQMDHQNFHRNIKGEVIDAMEAKIKKCEEAGCKNKISYKFRAGKADDEIVNEINETNFDLLILTTSHIDSWVRSLFSDARKIISNVSIPILIIQ